MVFGKAPEADARGSLDGEFVAAAGMPVLRIRGFRQGREKGGWHTEIPLPVVREEVQPAYRHRVRFPQDPDLGMDRVPDPPIRIPFRRHLREGQQKRPYHRLLLDQEGLRRPRWVPGRRRPLRQGMAR